MVSRHTHLHLNVQKSMNRHDIAEDVEKMFSLGTNTVGACELETEFHHQMFRYHAKKAGYAVYLPDLGHRGSALGLAVQKDYGKIISTASIFCSPGKAHVTPSRYLAKMRVQRYLDDQKVRVDEHHAASSGWTGVQSRDGLRRFLWGTGMRVVTTSERAAVNFNDVVLGAGDLNRPPGAFERGKVLYPLLDPKGMVSAGYFHTDHTHGPTTFDYVWFLSKRHKITAKSWSTPEFHSDHDGVLITITW